MEKIAILPKPVSLETSSGFFTLDVNTVIAHNEMSQHQAEQLLSFLSPATGFSFKWDASTVIELNLNGSKNLAQKAIPLGSQSSALF